MNFKLPLQPYYILLTISLNLKGPSLLFVTTQISWNTILSTIPDLINHRTGEVVARTQFIAVASFQKKKHE